MQKGVAAQRRAVQQAVPATRTIAPWLLRHLRPRGNGGGDADESPGRRASTPTLTHLKQKGRHPALVAAAPARSAGRYAIVSSRSGRRKTNRAGRPTTSRGRNSRATTEATADQGSAPRLFPKDLTQQGPAIRHF